jgi:hypothetical protein
MDSLSQTDAQEEREIGAETEPTVAAETAETWTQTDEISPMINTVIRMNQVVQDFDFDPDHDWQEYIGVLRIQLYGVIGNVFDISEKQMNT